MDDVDPLIAADIDGNGVLNAVDTALLTQRTRTASTMGIPAIPVLPLPLAVSSSTSAQALLAAGTANPTTRPVGARTVNLNSSATTFSIKRSTTAAPPVLATTAALSALKISLNASSAGVSIRRRSD
jgi:hypothetical protein